MIQIFTAKGFADDSGKLVLKDLIKEFSVYELIIQGNSDYQGLKQVREI